MALTERQWKRSTYWTLVIARRIDWSKDGTSTRLVASSQTICGYYQSGSEVLRLQYYDEGAKRSLEPWCGLILLFRLRNLDCIYIGGCSKFDNKHTSKNEGHGKFPPEKEQVLLERYGWQPPPGFTETKTDTQLCVPHILPHVSPGPPCIRSNPNAAISILSQPAKKQPPVTPYNVAAIVPLRRESVQSSCCPWLSLSCWSFDLQMVSRYFTAGELREHISRRNIPKAKSD